MSISEAFGDGGGSSSAFGDGGGMGMGMGSEGSGIEVTNSGGIVGDTLNSFASSSASAAESSYDFTNNIVTKFFYVLLILIAFIFLLNMGLKMIGYMYQNSTNAYVVNGLIPGNIQYIVHQNTAFSNAVTLNRSNNRPYGIEFTWSMWLMVPSNTAFDKSLSTDTRCGGSGSGTSTSGGDSGNSNGKHTQGLFQHLFNVGDLGLVDNNVYTINGPGVYLRKNVFDEKDMQLVVMMDTVKTLASSQEYWTSSCGSGQQQPQQPPHQQNSTCRSSAPDNILQVSNLPVMKWIHIAIRVEGTTMDVYVNGTVAGRLIFDAVPYQNYYDINCCCNNGFNGSMSNLQYFNYAMTSFDINMIVYRGPNLTQANNLADCTSYGQPYYLNSSWFMDKMAVN